MKFLKILLIITLSITCPAIYAQVNKIKKDSDKNKNASGNSNKKVTPNNNTSNNGCVESCFNVCGAVCFSAFSKMLIDLHTDYLDNASKVPPTVSLDIMPHIGYKLSNTGISQPRLRGNWGIFSTDIRLNSLIESANNGYDFYNTIDWQVIELNPLITKPVILRFGTGFMYEFSSKQFFNEHFVGLDLFFMDYQYMTNAEFRIAPDYETGEMPRIEGALRFNYRFLESKSIFGYGTVGGLYQNYYTNTEMIGIMAGVTFNIH